MSPQRNQRHVQRLAGAILALCIAWSGSSLAQMHKVAAPPEKVVRAIGVYEWTGDMAKPNASRIIPITLFIDGKLQDAGIYLARPVPFALLTGNIYELDQAGVAKGTVDLLYSKHFVATDNATTTYDDGWFGYGTFVPPPAPRKEVASNKPAARTSGIVSNAVDDDDDNDDKPHFSAKSAKPGTGGSAESVPAPTASTDSPAADPDRPIMHRPAGTTDSSNTTSPSSTTASTTPTADPDRPTMRRRSDTSDTTAPSDSSKTSDPPADDPDRPTLRRRAPEDAKKAKTPQASVSDPVVSLNDDPNRPTLHRGKSAGAPSEADFPRLSGLPGDQDLHQMIAVSDAANRTPHDFARKWDDEAEHQAILAKMQAAARAQLAAYESAASAKKPVLSAPDTRHPNSKLRRNLTPDAAPAPEPLLDEQLTAYTLSYGGSATFVYSAHTGGPGPTQCFITLVAQVDIQGEPAIAFKSVTDAAHLDRTPRIRLVDAVDAEASNRASLLFELRAQNARQFALYRVIGARADQIFLTGTTQ